MRGWKGIVLALVVIMAAPGMAMAKRLEAVRLQGLTLMAEPKDGAGKLRVLRAGETVSVLGRNGNWVEVSLDDGTRGFVQGGFLTGFEDIQPVATYASRMDQSVVRPAQSVAADKAKPTPVAEKAKSAPAAEQAKPAPVAEQAKPAPEAAAPTALATRGSNTCALCARGR